MLSIRNFLILLFSLVFSSILAQELHTPSEMYAMMKKSAIRYEIDSLFQGASPASWPVLQEGWLNNSGDQPFQKPAPVLMTQTRGQKYHKKADKFFEEGQFAKAARFYHKALSELGSPVEEAVLRKQLCRSYLQLGKILAAGESLLALGKSHRNDFTYHSLLATIYEKSNQRKLAITHVSLAHLLNRNDPVVLEQLVRVYAKYGMAFHSWNFHPQYQLKQTTKGVLLTYREAPWRAYGACRAVWQNEPEYAQRMARISTESVAHIEQKECLLNALIAFEQAGKDSRKFPELQALDQALRNNEIDWFILYEIDARQNPLLIHELEDEGRMALVAYIQKYHLK